MGSFPFSFRQKNGGLAVLPAKNVRFQHLGLVGFGVEDGGNE